ncbi:RNA-binding domain-containing protein [Parathielavia hyrcaniae]|uniref:RNA-binding domain-containing protein n=1 Tax=Parathielavia hyrcaniae TaxID=113614 RepID=A0AAN6T340_9PEZI|nr:RNA-binding domain-containing protein [Parathielavia hyrcaniae]
MADISQSHPLSQRQLLARSELQPRQEPLANQNPQPEPPDEIVVERLTKNVNEDHLYEIFGQYGEIEDLDLPIGRTTGFNRGTAYILYFSEDDAQSAITHMHEAQLDGAVIHVSIVLPRRKVSPAPPVARRGPRGPPANVRSVLSGGGPAGGRGFRSPAPGSGGGGPSGRLGARSGDVYRPRSVSRSRSPALSRGSRRYRSRSRSASYTSRSPSRTPPPPGGRPGAGRARRGSRGYGRRRSPSRDSYDSYDRRSRSRSRSRDRR